MSLGILGQKLGMTQIYNEEGQAVPVTVVEAGPCPVLAVRTEEKNGYDAILLGFGKVKPRKVTKPLKGFFDKAQSEAKRWLKEFRISNASDYEVGNSVDVAIFEAGEKVDATGVSKGKGFAGVIKRYNFGGAPASHGVSKTHRKPNSSGASSYPSHVFKGKTMPGQLGNEQVTVKNLTVVAVDVENNLVLVKGAIPGAKNGLVLLHKKG
ncbi:MULTISPECIES: 50S ribosomal protein L3 [Dethiosulfovibrio]|jgi:large subunit ribosomal protein L3|uniref:Large ribosomal subunit protein uL3 n=2 Tax=Dethiosulfovibrio TaxID=47054 RepID=A0ABS9ENL5_9BACT|nr:MULTISPECIES: 50S ribosomal protein L3 [Dethiosulfovibrio]MCF4113006.1 50S ribosomal protein L3 [Dethiosulfovibrio russensis]MCF4141470.1 50S ribosomal protein L3 [Dethiosulfovibrio marinus]MCF4144426.1 50S ribosomal protein L3 [Dethiosulfovibrio acidaminovorans]